MPFKIIQTKERNKVQLIAVPSTWEHNSVLRWPKQPHKIINDDTSIPQAHWCSIPCSVKRNNINTYEAAEKEITNMLTQSDTEEETSVRPKNTALKPLDLNSANELRQYMVYNDENDGLTMPEVRDVEINSGTDGTMPLITDTNTVYNLQIVDGNAGNCNETKILETLNQVLTNQSVILEAVQSLQKIQDNLVQRVAGFSVQLDDLSLQIKQPDSNIQPLMESRNTIENTPIYIQPIENIRALNELERSLSDKNTKQALFQTYSIVCGKGKATDCAYRYAEIMFDRKFLCECSWSGGSRSENSKIPFKDFKNVIHFFWSLVYAGDDKYTLKDNDDFFKSLLKNSRKRLESKNQRASTSRLRAKRTKLNVINPTTIVDTTLNDIDTTDGPKGDETVNQVAEIPSGDETNLSVDNEESLC